jgi:hypothetical protein
MGGVNRGEDLMFATARVVHSLRIAGGDSARPGWVLQSPPSRLDRVQRGAIRSSEADLRTSDGIVDAAAFICASSAGRRPYRGGFR